MKLPINTTDFKHLISNNYHYIDKTLLIKNFLEENAKNIVITRPRGFGKSLNLSMLYYFFHPEFAAENRQLFVDKKIATAHTEKNKPYMAYQGQHPIILLSFKGIEPTSESQLQTQMKELVANLYEQYAYLANSSKLQDYGKNKYNEIVKQQANAVSVEFALETLSKLLYQHHNNQSVIVLLDEYDTPFRQVPDHDTSFQQELIRFMQQFIGSALTGNNAVYKGMLVGVQRTIVLEYTDLDIFAVMNMTRPRFQEYFGFTQQESDQLIQEYSNINHAHSNTTNINNLANLIDQRANLAKQWYGGHHVNQVDLYNPTSLFNYLTNHFATNNYWTESSEDKLLIGNLLNTYQTVQQKLNILLSGTINHTTIEVGINDRAYFSVEKHSDWAFWALMIYAGYLQIVGETKKPWKNKHLVTIPNLQMKQAIEQRQQQVIAIQTAGQLTDTESTLLFKRKIDADTNDDEKFSKCGRPQHNELH